MLPFGIVGQLFRNVALPLDVRNRAGDLLTIGTLEQAVAESDSEAEMIQLFNDLTAPLLDLAIDMPILIAIDDILHADALSLRYLPYLVRRCKSTRILVALTDDIDQRPLYSSLRAELLRQPHFHQIRLGPLSRDGVIDLLAEHMDKVKAQLRAPEFFEITGGNPLLLHGLIDDHHLSGDVGARGYGQALLSCLHRGDVVNLQVGRALAVLGEHATPVELSQLVRVDVEAVIRALDTMTAAGLLDKGIFRHAVARSTLLNDLPRHERVDLHRRASRLLHDRGAPAIAVAHHLMEVDDAQDWWALNVLLEAAEQALRGDQTQLAVKCLMLAHRSSVREQGRAAIQARLARAEWQINPLVASRHLAPLVTAVRAGYLDRRDSIVLIRQLLWHGCSDEAVDVLDWLRGSINEQHAEAVTKLYDLELWLAYSYPSLAQRRRISVTTATQNTMVNPETDPWLRSTAKLADILARDLSHEAVDRAEHVLRGLRISRNTCWAEESAMLALLVLICADRCDSAKDWCDHLLVEANTRQAPTWQAILVAVRAEIAVRQGDLASAVHYGRATMTHMDAKSWGATIGFPLGNLILATTWMGHHEEAEKYINNSLVEASFRTRYGLHYLHARGQYYLATNHFHAALADFLSCGNLMREWGLDIVSLVPWRISAAEAWLRLGNQDQARRLIYEQLGRLGADCFRMRGLSLRLLAAVSPTAHRPKILNEALDLLEKCGDRFEQARILADLSHAYHALKQNRRGRMAFRRALHLARMCEANLLCQELLCDTSDFGDTETVSSSHDDAASLTSSEARVASLAVNGYTNREIANKLYITPSTVEQHLTRVYRKLNVKSRKDLPVDLRTDVSKMTRSRLVSRKRGASG
jgi:DNA-binding CsgD family transcriptional regulator